MNEKNLIPQSERTKSEQREIARMGGIASGVARRQKKMLKDIAQLIGEMKPSKQLQEIMEQAGFNDIDSNVGVLVARQYMKAIIDGDTKAAQWIANVLDEENTPQIDNLVEELKFIWAT